MLLEIKNLSKRFGGLQAINDLTLQVQEGEILGLIGPNGAGKTTLFNLISGVFSPDAGEIWFQGENITRLKPYQICKKGICRTFQIAQPFREMSILKNIMIGAFVHSPEVNKVEKEAEEILDFVGLGGKKEMLAKELTIIDQRRLEVARALATKPKLLLLDETMAGLNPKECDEAVLLIKKIREKGVTLIVVEHVMRAIMSLSERIIVLDYGAKIAEGEPEKIRHDEKVIRAYLGEEYRRAASR
ncbi:MAG: ABC transporter ATP-binding protein [Thermodesulfobacteriota bacterium]